MSGEGSVRAPRRFVRLRRALLGLALLLGLTALDVSRPPARQVTARLLTVSIDLYQVTLSRAFGAMGANCRFEPTCSHYGRAAIEHYGAASGSVRAVRRILRCNPWTEDGTWDPPYPGWSEPAEPEKHSAAIKDATTSASSLGSRLTPRARQSRSTSP